MNTSIRKFLAEEDGITALEYGILAAIVAAAIFAVFSTHFESLLQTLFDNIKASAGVK